MNPCTSETILGRGLKVGSRLVAGAMSVASPHLALGHGFETLVVHTFDLNVWTPHLDTPHIVFGSQPRPAIIRAPSRPVLRASNTATKATREQQ